MVHLGESVKQKCMNSAKGYEETMTNRYHGGRAYSRPGLKLCGTLSPGGC